MSMHQGPASGESAIVGYLEEEDTPMNDTVGYRHPEALIDAATLAARTDDPSLRVFDCTMHLLADRDDDPYRVESGLADYRKAHVPGSAFLDLRDLSVADAPYRFTMPAAGDLAARLGQAGMGDGHRIVLYSRGSLQWATRVWWMLRAIGVDAAVLDGGWEAWQSGGHPDRDGDERYPPASLTARPRPGLFVGRDETRAAIGDPSTLTINALSPALHAGRGARYGRPGRVPGSVNVPASSLREPATGRLVDADTAAAAFEAAGVRPGRRVLIYCGGGIAATLDAFVLHQLGHDDVAVYDNSLSEWATDPALPIETD